LIPSVIASQRVGAKRRPMTGSAKQSILPRNETARALGLTISPALLVTAERVVG
jgi:hypothetical protein